MKDWYGLINSVNRNWNHVQTTTLLLGNPWFWIAIYLFIVATPLFVNVIIRIRFRWTEDVTSESESWHIPYVLPEPAAHSFTTLLYGFFDVFWILDFLVTFEHPHRPFSFISRHKAQNFLSRLIFHWTIFRYCCLKRDSWRPICCIHRKDTWLDSWQRLIGLVKKCKQFFIFYVAFVLFPDVLQWPIVIRNDSDWLFDYSGYIAVSFKGKRVYSNYINAIILWLRPPNSLGTLSTTW